ncbi:hypothetical protein [Bacillus sp. AK031]
MQNRLKKLKAVLTQCLIMLSIFCFIVPMTAHAAGDTSNADNVQEGNVQSVNDSSIEQNDEEAALIRLVADVPLENGITLNEGQLIFVTIGKENEALVQVGSLMFNIPLEAFQSEEVSQENAEEYISYEDSKVESDTITLPAGLSLYADSDEAIASVTKSVDLPILKQDDLKYYLILGSRLVYVNKSELESQSTETEDSSGEKEETVPVSEEPVSTEEPISESESEETAASDSTATQENAAQTEDEIELSAQAEEETTTTLPPQEAKLTFEEAGFLKAATPTLSIYDNSSGSLVKVGDIVEGQSFRIVETIGNWHKIKFNKGYGFVWKGSTIPSTGEEITNTAPVNNPAIFEVLSDVNLSVYDNTSGSLVRMGNIAPGVKYPVIAEIGNWYKIEFSGRIGYVYKPATKLAFNSNHKYFKVTTDYLSVYDTSSGEFVKVGALNKNQEYPIESVSGNWIKVKFGNGFGYIWKDSTVPVTKHSIKNLNSGMKDSARMLYSDKYLSVYDNTSGELVQFGSIQPNTKYPIIDRTGNWYKVSMAGRIGYVYEPPTFTTFLSSDKFFEVKKETDVYDNRSGSLKKVGILSQGETFRRVEDAGDMHKINFGDYYGYVYESDTSVGFENNIQSKSTYPSSAQSDGKIFITLQDVPVFDNGSGSLVKIAVIQKGEAYPFKGTMGNWIEIDLGGHIGYVYKTGVQIGPVLDNNYYSTSFDQALEIQLTRAPQNDTTKYEAYVHSGAFTKIEGNFGFVKDVWNVRGGPGVNYWQLNAKSVVAVNGPLIDDEKVEILSETTIETAAGKEKWYKINFYKTYRLDGNGNYNTHYRAFVNASRTHVAHYMDPANFVNDENARFQFLKLSESADADANRINELMLSNRGGLKGKGAAFVEAGKRHNINEIYLVSHSILETGAGSSRESVLLKGYKINSVKGQSVPEKTVYNVYGIAAYDGCPGSPAVCAAEFAYEEGWFTVEAAIIGGAKFIGEKYIHREGNQQDTLYKMRWNPESPGTHQYATDVGWAVKQAVNYFSSYYSILGLKPKTFDIPVYGGDPGK